MYYSPPQTNLTRILGLGLVVALHAALIYALAAGLAHRVVDVVRHPVMTTIIEKAPQQEVPQPQPPAPRFAPPEPILMPPPAVNVAKPPPPPPPKVETPKPPPPAAPRLETPLPTPPPPRRAAPTAITPVRPPPAPAARPQPVTAPKPAVAPPPAPAAPKAAAPVRVAPRLDSAKSHEPEYPAAARRLGEQGSLLMEVLVDMDGRVLDTRLVKSSGFERLDRAALEGVKADYRFLPGTVDGKPQRQWFTIRFTWKLQ